MRVAAGEFWRVVRVVYGGGLENRWPRKGPGGSNPSPSAEQIGDVLVLTAMLVNRKHAGLCR